MTKLPKKLSALLRLAVEDAKKCEVDDRYRFDMTSWHTHLVWGSDSKCAVCMAGAVMAKSLGASILRDFNPEDFEDAESLHVIDRMRVGWLPNDIFVIWPTRFRFREIVTGSEGGVDEETFLAPWERYIRAANFLESKGL